MWGIRLWAGSPSDPACPGPVFKKHVSPLAPPSTNSISDKLDIWEKELKHDPDSEFLLHGIRHGFDVCDTSVTPDNVETDNYRSATCVEHRDKVEKQILWELDNGNYEIVKEKPNIVSALGAIPKQGSDDIRLIHDCSMPLHGSLNDYAELDHKAKYQTIGDAAELVTPGVWMCKVDLKAAYRSIKIGPGNYKFTGLKWRFSGDSHDTYMIDKKLMFGSKLAPGIFHRISQSVRRMLQKRGIVCSVVFIDDFLIVADSQDACMQAMNLLISLLRQLGFAISWSKVYGPTQCITFLGVQIDSIQMLLSLPQEKVNDMLMLVDKFLTMKRASKKQLQSLAGKLNWASSVVRGGRIYLRAVLNMIQPLRAQNHKVILKQDFFRDLCWWKQSVELCNGRAIIPQHTEVHMVSTDACTAGSGYFWNGRWGYVNFEQDFPQCKDLHINVKETFSVLFAARQYAPLWRGSMVIFGVDNTTARSALKNKTSKNPLIMEAIRELFALSVAYDFDFDGFYCPGVNNGLSDCVSRLNQPGQLQLLQTILPRWHFPPDVLFPFSEHMSFSSFTVCVFPQIQRSHLQKCVYSLP